MSKKLIISSSVLLVIAALVFLLVYKDKKVEPVVDLEETGELSENNTTSQNQLGDVLNAAPEIKFDTTNKEAFDDLMVKGNKAFVDKKYTDAISFFQQALKLKDADVVYARLFAVYSVQGNTVKAIESINKAIEKFPAFTDYWVSKLVYLDEKTNTSFNELKDVYADGLSKVDIKTKANLAINFARIAESNGMKDEAIAAWQQAIELYPANKATYQAEIDRLKSL